MNPRRRFKSLVPPQEDPEPRRRQPAPAGGSGRKRADKAAGAAWLFADFLAACMALPPDQLADLE
jgi:hypothetical protein